MRSHRYGASLLVAISHILLESNCLCLSLPLHPSLATPATASRPAHFTAPLTMSSNNPNAASYRAFRTILHLLALLFTLSAAAAAASTTTTTKNNNASTATLAPNARPVSWRGNFFHVGQFEPRTGCDACVNTFRRNSQPECVACCHTAINDRTASEIAAARITYLFRTRLLDGKSGQNRHVFLYPTDAPFGADIPEPHVLVTYSLTYASAIDAYVAPFTSSPSSVRLPTTTAVPRAHLEAAERQEVRGDELYQCVRRRRPRDLRRLRVPRMATFQIFGKKDLNPDTVASAVDLTVLQYRLDFSVLFRSSERSPGVVFRTEVENERTINFIFEFRDEYIKAYKQQC